MFSCNMIFRDFSLNFPYKFAVFYHFSKNTTNAADEPSGGKDRQNMTFLFWRDKSINDFRG